MRDQKLRQQQQWRMEWRNEMDRENRDSPSHLQGARGFRQPLLPRPTFGTLNEEESAEDNQSAKPVPPPRLARQASNVERARIKFENKPY